MGKDLRKHSVILKNVGMNNSKVGVLLGFLRGTRACFPSAWIFLQAAGLYEAGCSVFPRNGEPPVAPISIELGWPCLLLLWGEVSFQWDAGFPLHWRRKNFGNWSSSLRAECKTFVRSVKKLVGSGYGGSVCVCGFFEFRGGIFLLEVGRRGSEIGRSISGRGSAW